MQGANKWNHLIQKHNLNQQSDTKCSFGGERLHDLFGNEKIAVAKKKTTQLCTVEQGLFEQNVNESILSIWTILFEKGGKCFPKFVALIPKLSNTTVTHISSSLYRKR